MSLPIYQPTMRRPDADFCNACANASAFDETGMFECRYLDAPHAVEAHESETAAAVLAVWKGDEPDSCPGWAEPVAVACDRHGPYLYQHGCPRCDYEFNVLEVSI